MIRRGILGVLLGGAAAAVAPAKEAHGVMLGAPTPMPLREGRAIAASMACSNPVSEADVLAAKRLERRLTAAEQRLSRVRWRREKALNLCGGYAPHIAPCKSWAPWFKAARSVAWEQEVELREEAEERRVMASLANGAAAHLLNMLPEWMVARLEQEE